MNSDQTSTNITNTANSGIPRPIARVSLCLCERVIRELQSIGLSRGRGR